jgi:hypothetical protein
MPERFDYRRHFLRAVQSFLAGTPTSIARGNRILAACPRTKPFTVSDMVWGSMRSTLNDTLIQGDVQYLEQLQRFLSGDSLVIKQGFFSYDLRSDMHPREWEWYTQLQEMLNFLERFPFADVDSAVSEYELRCAKLETLSEQVNTFDQDMQEAIHDLVLREVASVALNIDMKLSLLSTKHLAPKSGYVGVYPYQRPPNVPDASGSVVWARKALLAIAGQDWLYLSWQINKNGLQFSLH